MHRRATAVLVLTALTAGATPALTTQDGSADALSALLPADTLVAVEAADLGASVRALLELPSWTRFDDGPLGDALRAAPKTEELLKGLAALGAAARTDELGLLDALAGDGAAFGLLPPAAGAEEPRSVALFRADDASAVQAAVNGLLGFVTLGTTRVSGTDWRVPLGDGVAERRGDLFLLGSAASALEAVGVGETTALRDIDGYRDAQAELAGDDLRVFARGDLFRGDDGLPEKAENAAGSLLAGGPNEVLRRAPWAALGLRVGERGLHARLVAPADAEALRASHAPLLPAAAPLDVPRTEGRLATLVLPRDLGPWWTARDDFVDERGVAETIEGDGNLSVVFQRDLGSEVLRWLEPGLLLVVDRNRFEDGVPEPEFPAGALGLQPREGRPDDYHQAFVNAFFAVVTFTNFDGGDATRPMLQPDMELLDDGSRLHVARFRRTGDDDTRPARENLSPGVLLRPDGRIWISSSETLLRDLAAAPVDTVTADGDALDVDLVRAVDLLDANEETVFARQLLAQGGDAVAAQERVERFAAAAGLFDDLRAHARLHDGLWELALEVTTR